MKISLRWVEELLGGPLALSPEELSQTLLRLGFEVASLRPVPGNRGVVVGEVLEVSKHPNADRLRIAKVTDGRETREVVCGAPNLEVGQKVFWAQVGAELAGGMKIQETAIRGVKSPGMLCSGRELGVGEDQSGLWVLDKDTAPGTPLEDLADLQDTILELEVTPNRPDCLSQIGIARELSAGLNLKQPQLGVKHFSHSSLPDYPVQIEDAAGCPRYIAKRIENVSVAPSTIRAQAWLLRCGVRPINRIVDATNLVLLELGQPLHAFDADKLAGGKIIVRRAKAGEKILALDGKTYALDPEILVIADAEKAVAVAGIMGGEETAVTAATKNVVLESAVFDRRLIRQARKKLGLASESSYRFERGVTRWSCENGSLRAEEMLLQSPGARTTAYHDSAAGSPGYSQPATLVRISQIEKILGEKVTSAEAESIFHRLGVEIPAADRQKFNVQAPAWRLDLTQEIDYIEEVARLKGYDQLPSQGTEIRLPSGGEQNPFDLKENVRKVMQALGFYEACNYGLVSQKMGGLLAEESFQAELENPLSEDQNVLRPALIADLARNSRLNLAYQKPDVRLFEIGTVFARQNGRFLEKTRAAGIACGRQAGENWEIKEPRPLDFFWIKGALERLLEGCRVAGYAFAPARREAPSQPFDFTPLSRLLHPSFAMEVRLGEGERIGCFGQIHPRAARDLDLPEDTVLFELDLHPLEQAAQRDKKIAPVARQPFIRRDCSIWIGHETPWADILAAAREAGGELLEDCRLFDLYLDPKQEGQKSLSFTLTFRHPEKTLDDATANRLRDQIIERLHKKFQARLRGQ